MDSKLGWHQHVDYYIYYANLKTVSQQKLISTYAFSILLEIWGNFFGVIVPALRKFLYAKKPKPSEL